MRLLMLSLTLALLLLATRAAPVPVVLAARLDPIPARPNVDGFMRRGAHSLPVDATPDESPAPDADLEVEIVESGAGWAVVRPRGCRLFLCL
ncbi:hypothetical protein B0H19DRAFT_1246255 [Mycena capillaripes]|nr:hypothetical protein B0H19DRAFT_1246255 [Mycena capillaripes]